MRALFVPPTFEDNNKTAQVANLFKLAWVVLIVLTVSVIGRVIAQPAALGSAAISLPFVLLLTFTVIAMARQGWVEAASIILIAGYILNIFRTAFYGGGVTFPGIAMLYLYAMAASLLLGARAGVITAAVSLIGSAGLVAAGYWGVLPASRIARYGDVYQWMLNGFYLSLTLFLVHLLTQTIRKANDREKAELTGRRQAENKLAIALDAAKIGIWEWTPSTGELIWDDQMYAIYEIPRSQEINYKIWAGKVLPQELAAQDLGQSQLLDGQQRSEREFRIRGKDGSIRYIFSAEKRFGSDGVTKEKIIGLNVDVTKRRQDEAEILRVKDQLETLVEQARIGILVHQNFKPVAVNTEMLAMFGMTEPEVLAVTDIRQFISKDAGMADVSYEHRLKFLEANAVTEARCLRKDGEWIDCEIRAFPIQWEGQASICAMVTDVTHKKRLEEQLRQAQRLEAVGQMTGGVAHDFNNLLTVILGNAEVMEKRLKDDAILAELAGMTRQAAEQGAELTSRLLAFSRRQALSIKPTDIGALILGMSGLIRRVLDQRFKLNNIVSPALWKASVDAAQLESALLNLAINARDAMPDGGKLTVEVYNARLSESDIADEGTSTKLDPGFDFADYVLVTVSDTGVGMDEKTRMRAFEPFFTTKDVGKGSGLGLSMVYGFVSQLGGHIRIYSESGSGTSIKLYLPRAHEEPTTEVRPEEVPVVGGTENILMVEDHDLVRRQVEAQLEGLGYNVTSARDGVEALEILKARGDFDLLFTDVVMPRGLNGRELAREAAIIRPGLPVLFTSGYTDNLFTQGHLDPSINVLTKPYRLGVLAVKLRHALGQSRHKWRALSDQ